MSKIPLNLFGGFNPPVVRASFSPNNITNILSWFRGSEFDLITDGTDATIWTDQTLRAVNATAIGGAGNRPVVARNSINGTMTSLASSGGHRGLVCSAVLTNVNTWTLFTVIKFTAIARYYYRYDDGGSAGVRMGLDGNSKFSFIEPNVANYNTNEVVSINQWHYIVVVSIAGIRQIYVDGILLTWQSTPSPSQSGGSNLEFALFEGNSFGSDHLQGNIADAAFFNAAVGPDERITNLEEYARLRYNLP